ncbi:hypothetical protein [Nonomuraea aurantiaca]|uniref:hypothetical protein n=1 Tax=Nonomuraea aurantiaca TaxID=2878562 RepID=UPI001CD94AF1|nr:hypothetical protein [Nonomuraea aurantiaca]MCA2227502.1 hypothetical protein [Nonomuraea aurantiaca]
MTKRWTIPALATVMVFTLAGCKYPSWTETGCRQEAVQETVELKKATSALLPESIAARLEARDDCDSGDEGGWLTATADGKTPSGTILEGFAAKGWTRLNLRKDECNVECIAGVTNPWHGKKVEVVVGATQQVQIHEVIIAFAE